CSAWDSSLRTHLF
nr:immunoglobulin light chain junction region [Macaca mulatta]